RPRAGGAGAAPGPQRDPDRAVRAHLRARLGPASGGGRVSDGSMGIDDGPPLSIGEVLSQLQEEFPDVTISKIRFLESQGLIDPERTPSGYRKFYAGDVERLRWILQEQRDNFLPLKVIKDRLPAHQPAVEGTLA